MDQNDKATNAKIIKLENEIKILKNEVQAVLLDLRESYLNMENPFNQTAASPAAVHPIVINEQAPTREPKQEVPANNSSKAETGGTENIKIKNLPPLQPEAVKPEKIQSEESLPGFETALNIGVKEAEIKPVLHWKPETRPVKSESAVRNIDQLNLVTMAGIIGWVEQSCKKMGKEKTEAVLEISESMGYVSKELKPTISKLISLATQNNIQEPIKTRDYIDSLIKINGILGKDNREETTLLLLSLISGDTNHG
jgi:hypothetical protein